METFLRAFGETFLAVSQLGLIIGVAVLLVRLKRFDGSTVKGVSDAVVLVFLPCLIFSNVLRQFQPAEFPLWWLLPLAAVLTFLGGFVIAGLLFWGQWREKRPLLAMASLQNAGYLTLPIGQVLLPPEQFPQFALYVFLFILAYNPLLWSVGKLLVSGTGGKWRWSGLVTPPLIANVLALTLVFSGLREALPQSPIGPAWTVLTRAAAQLGEATIPVATFVLGASLGTIPLGLGGRVGDVLRVVLSKLLLAPAAAFLVLTALGWRTGEWGLVGFMLMLQAASAPATAIVLQIQTFGGDLRQAGPPLVSAYVACLVTIPLWIALWRG